MSQELSIRINQARGVILVRQTLAATQSRYLFARKTHSSSGDSFCTARRDVFLDKQVFRVLHSIKPVLTVYL